MNRLKIKFAASSKWVKSNRVLLLSISLLAVLCSSTFLYRSSYWQWADWTGLGADTNVTEENTWENGKPKTFKSTKQFQSGKTLWDWLGLAGVIAIPIILYQFQQQQQKRSEEQAEVEKKQAQERADLEKEIAASNLREEALENYIDKMAELLIDKRLKVLLEKISDLNIDIDHEDILGIDPKLDAALDVARARTLSILRRLDGDGERKGSVVRFLIDAELIRHLGLLREANLSGANLSEVDLSFADLSESNLSHANLVSAKLLYVKLNLANLSHADLFGATLSGANLFRANLSSAGLSDSNLSEVNLEKTNLQKAFLCLANLFAANLYEADFSEANLLGANFESAKKLTPEQIKKATDWEQAIYDPDFRKELGLPSETTP